jgi:ubiquinone/menaquinone biosynthesis C-methylase UbiE
MTDYMDAVREFFNELSNSQDMNQFGDEDTTKLKEQMAIWNLKPGDVILETGSGTGRLTPHLLKVIGNDGLVCCVDFAMRMLLKAKARGLGENVKLIQADASALPVADEFCDVVLCFAVFPHISDKRKAMEESFRILKPSGKLLISHLAKREKINAFHSKAGHPIGDDLIPADDKVIQLLLDTGFQNIRITDNDGGYLAMASKA